MSRCHPSALYLQLVLGYSPLRVGLAFLPANLIMAVFSLGLSAKLVMRFGIRAPLAIGLLLAAIGLALLARAPIAGNFGVDVLPSMLAASTSPLVALNGGYHAAFLVGAVCAAIAASLSAVLLRARQQVPTPEYAEEVVAAPEPEPICEPIGR